MTGDQITQLIVALTTLIGVITALVKTFRTDSKVVAGNAKLDNVQELVNGNHHIALARIDQLGDSLTNAGVAIPDKPEVKPGEGVSV